MAATIAKNAATYGTAATLAAEAALAKWGRGAWPIVVAGEFSGALFTPLTFQEPMTLGIIIGLGAVPIAIAELIQCVAKVR